MEPSVFDEMQFGFIRHISQMKQIYKAVGCGTGSGNGSIVLHAGRGDFGSDSLGHEREEFSSVFNMGAQHRCLGLEPSIFDKMRIGVSIFQRKHGFLAVGGGAVSGIGYLISMPSVMVPVMATATMGERSSLARFLVSATIFLVVSFSSA